MGLWQTITGRSRPKRADLDSLFAVPNAVVTLQTAAGFLPTGAGSVCYRAATGAGFSDTQDDVLELLRAAPEAPEVEVTRDAFGFTWLQVHHEPDDISDLCIDLHAVNTTLEAQGFAAGLLCSVVGFRGPDQQRFGLVYLYKQGTYYPFAPTGPQSRDNLLELQVRDVLAGELPVEQDLGRWLALWGAPGL